MQIRRRLVLSSVPLTGIAALFAVTIGNLQPAPAQSADREPIAFIGHGAMFDADGKQIVPTPEFVATAQAWYRSKLASTLPVQRRRLLEAEEKSFNVLPLQGQEKLLTDQQALELLVAETDIKKTDPRMPGKISLLGSALDWKLPEDKSNFGWRREKFNIRPKLNETLKKRRAKRLSGVQSLTTNNTGQDYIDECAANDVPIPPPINRLAAPGVLGWTSRGFIPQSQQFIVGTPAEIRSYEDNKGVCIALPRYTNSSLSTVFLDGVICQSKVSSKVCIWDNQRASPPSSGNGVGFSFPSGTEIPIGVPAIAGGLYQGGGKEIEFGSGGVCTDCHAGENAYIIHPDAELENASGTGLGLTMGDLSSILPMFAPNRYDPIIGASWPKNNLSHALPLVPTGCKSCHQQGDAGRLPHLSSAIPSFCGTILTQAVEGPSGIATMPQGSAGTMASSPAYTNFKAFCGTAPSSGPSTRGDPHLLTTNGISYDFQAAGEFVALRNSDSGFEMQTRQTPVKTSFVPGPNPYTGLASCVSLNTAAAFRLGERRISFQPVGTGSARSNDPSRMMLRVDGFETKIPAGGLNLGGGNRLKAAAAGGGIDVRSADGTEVLVTPNFWSSQGYWYLNVEVLNTPAREGTMGHIGGNSWLPYSPKGLSFGPKPAALADRHTSLNQKFADAWRVNSMTSLFDYLPGTTTDSFTDREWPSMPGGSCSLSKAVVSLPLEGRPSIKPIERERAIKMCGLIKDKVAFEQCVFDVANMGEPTMARAFMLSLARSLERRMPFLFVPARW